MESTTAVSPIRSTQRKLALRIVVAILIVLLIAFLAFDFWFYRAVRAALPQVEGTIHLPALTAPVTVSRDSLGVPTISAGSVSDLFYAQGYVTAQDRLWQMDVTRRYASGDLSEIFGPEYVKVDRAQRILGLRQVAERIAANMPPEQRAQFAAYARGVNAYIDEHRKTLPLEFRFLVYFPHAWTVEDSVLVGLSMNEFLNHYLYKDELEKEKVLAKLGPELTADLFVNSSWRDHPPGAESNSIENTVPGEPDSDEEEHDESHTTTESPAPYDAVIPSGEVGAIRHRSWLLAAANTRRDKGSAFPPNLQDKKGPNGRSFGDAPASASVRASDSLAGRFGTPSTAYARGRFVQDDTRESGNNFGETLTILDHRMRAGSNTWVVSGAHTASGRPLLSNDMHLELGIPNIWYEAHLIAGDYDVAGVTLPGVPYVIVGHNRYIAWGFTNLGPNVEDVYVEKFNDQGEYLTPQGWQQPEHRKEVIRVKGKPEVNLDVEVTRHGPIITDLIPGESRKLALKWIIYDPQIGRSTPFFAINSAKNWEEFRAAFAQFDGPAQNVVYADVDGHIGYQATGRIPIRATGDGSLPVPGDDDAHEWTGYVPFDKLPSVYDPSSGMIATANGRITPGGYPYLLSIEWESPFRTERIYKLLTVPHKKFSPADMLAIQTDVVSEFDRYCAQRMVYAVDHSSKASQRAKTAADLMRNWNGRMDTDLAAPTVEVYSRHKLEELLLEPKLGGAWKEYEWFMSPVWLQNMLSHQPPRWLPAGYANFDDLLTAAVEGAVSDADAPLTLNTWKWGRIHRVDITHPFWSHFPILKRAAGPGSQPLSGNGLTVKQVSTHFGPSERLTVDFSNFDATTLNVVNGQSGNIFDEHYNDQWDAYYHGRTFALPFSPGAVERAAAHHLRLEP